MPAPLLTTPDVRNITLGTGELFINDVHVGVGKNATFEIGEELAHLESGRPLSRIASEVIRQFARVTFQAAELSSAQIRRVLTLNEVSTGAALHQAAPIPVSFASGDTQSLGRTNIVDSSGNPAGDADVSVFNLDRSVTYTPTTDYTIDPVLGTITRVGAGAIPAGGDVQVAFAFYLANAEVTRTGGFFTCPVLTSNPVSFVFQTNDCRLMEINFFRARSAGALTLNFNEGEFNVNDLSFEALRDPTRPLGQQLYEIIVEPN